MYTKKNTSGFEVIVISIKAAVVSTLMGSGKANPVLPPLPFGAIQNSSLLLLVLVMTLCIGAFFILKNKMISTMNLDPRSWAGKI